MSSVFTEGEAKDASVATVGNGWVAPVAGDDESFWELSGLCKRQQQQKKNLQAVRHVPMHASVAACAPAGCNKKTNQPANTEYSQWFSLWSHFMNYSLALFAVCDGMNLIRSLVLERCTT